MMNQYKRQFSEKILPAIINHEYVLVDRGYKYVGVLEDGSSCCSCYAIGRCDNSHNRHRWISYEEFVNEGKHVMFHYTKPPVDAFRYIFRNGDYVKLAEMLFHVRNLRHNLDMAVLQSVHN